LCIKIEKILDRELIEIELENAERLTWVWRNGGCGSYDTLCVTATFGSRPNICEPRHFAKPLLVVRQLGDRAVSIGK